jgi:acetate kinase
VPNPLHLRSAWARKDCRVAFSMTSLTVSSMAAGSERAQPNHVLAINSGSSSIKFALYRVANLLELVLKGKFERVGLPNGELKTTHVLTGETQSRPLSIQNHAACVPPLIELLENTVRWDAVQAIGHRVVHGGSRFTESQLVTRALLDELHRLGPFVPDHLPSGTMLIEAIHNEYSNVPQFACFDTAFHRTMPRVAKLLPIPRRFEAKGIQRYGFHGLSYSFIMQELSRLAPESVNGRLILAHLGNGASMAAVKNGRCIDTSMSFTPTGGFLMSTRSGDLDPGLLTYLFRVEGMTGEQIHLMTNKESGLLGISETSPDMRDLLGAASTDVRAVEAVSLFCYQAKKWLGSFAAALGGLDTLVFAGGIGENAADVRTRICSGLDFLGLQLDASRNQSGAPIISPDHAKVTVRIIRTDEERFIADSVLKLLASSDRSPPPTP